MFPIQITQRHILSSQSVDDYIHERAAKLEQIYHRVISCHVVLDIIPKHNRFKKTFRSHLTLTVPGKELVINRQENEDIYLSIRDAFVIAERVLRKYAQSKRPKHEKAAKNQEAFAHAEIV